MLKRTRDILFQDSNRALLITLLFGFLAIGIGLINHLNRILEGISYAYLQSATNTTFIFFILSLVAAKFKRSRIPILAFYIVFYLAGIANLMGFAEPFLGILIFISSAGYGSYIFNSKYKSLNLLLGLSAVIALLNIITLFPINYSITYTIILSIGLGLLFFNKKSGDLKTVHTRLFSFFSDLKFADAFLLFLFWGILFFIGGFVVLPEDTFDSLAYQLMPITHIQFHHIWNYSFEYNVMAAVPKGMNWLFAYGTLLSSIKIARLINFFLLACFNVFLIEYFYKKISTHILFLTCSIITSLPLTFLLATSSLVDLGLMVFVVTTYILLVNCKSSEDIKPILWLLLLLPAIKHTGLIYSSIGGLALILANRNLLLSRTSVMTILVGLLCFMFPSYVWIWYKTGNPVFPFFNGFFKSALFEAGSSFSNSMYKKPLNLVTFYKMTFFTEEYSESKPGGIGIVHLFFSGTLLWPLFIKNQKHLKTLILMALISFVFIFKFQSYDRYLYPSLILIIIYYLLTWDLNAKKTILKIVGLLMVISSLIFNLVFLDAHTWNPTRDIISQFFSPEYKSDLISKKTDNQEIADYLNNRHSYQYTILQLNTSCYAYYYGQVLSDEWYSYNFKLQLQAAKNVEQMAELLKSKRIDYILNHKRYDMNPVLKEMIQQKKLVLEKETNKLQLFKLSLDATNSQ